MRTFLKMSLLLAAFAGTVTTAGCKKKVDTALAAVDLQNPGALFANGVLLLQNPNKEAEIDYATAYERFASSARLFTEQDNKPYAAKAWFNAGWVAELTSRPSEAIEHYRSAFEADPTYEQAFYSITRLLKETGRGEEAAKLFENKLAATPGDLAVRNELVQAYAAAKQYDRAIEEAKEILRHDSKNAAVYRSLSAMYYAQGNYTLSQLCSEKALELAAGDSGTYNNLGVTFLTRDDESGAVEHFKKALELDPNNLEANLNLGFIALSAGHFALGLESFQKATTIDPTSIDAKLGLAVALRGTGDMDGAQKLYDQIIKLDPDNVVAYFNAATLQEKYSKDFNKALKYLQAYADRKTGTLPADHEVFTRIAGVNQSKAAEEARQAELKRKEQERKDREERALATLKELETVVAEVEAKLAKNAACLDPAFVEELNMGFVDSAKTVITEKDTSLAADVKSMYTDYYGPTLDEAITTCAGAATPTEPSVPAEAPPTEGETPAPAAP